MLLGMLAKVASIFLCRDGCLAVRVTVMSRFARISNFVLPRRLVSLRFCVL